MPTDYRTLENKVRYVLARDQRAQTSDSQLALTLWRTFYDHLIVKDDAGVESFRLLNNLEIPSLSQIRAARKAIDRKTVRINDARPRCASCGGSGTNGAGGDCPSCDGTGTPKH